MFLTTEKILKGRGMSLREKNPSPQGIDFDVAISHTAREETKEKIPKGHSLNTH